MEISELNTPSVTWHVALRIYRKSLGRVLRGLSRGALWGKRLQWLLVPQKLPAIPVNYRMTDVEEGSLDMATRKKSTQPSLVNKGAPPSERKSDGNGYKLHLALDKQSYARLVWLQGALRASSFGEVLRRALDAYEVFEPEGVAEGNDTKSDRVISRAQNADVEHLYIVISNEMKDQLDSEKSANGRTYKETIRLSLCVLMQLVRERAKLVANLKKGSSLNDRNLSTAGNTNPALLACL